MLNIAEMPLKFSISPSVCLVDRTLIFPVSKTLAVFVLAKVYAFFTYSKICCTLITKGSNMEKFNSNLLKIDPLAFRPSCP